MQKKHARLCFFLLTQGCDINGQNIHTLDSALHYAVRNVDHKLVELLLSWDADPNLMNRNKETPISLAQDVVDDNILDALLEARADLYGNADADDGNGDVIDRTDTLDVQKPELHKKSTSQRLEQWTAKRDSFQS